MTTPMEKLGVREWGDSVAAYGEIPMAVVKIERHGYMMPIEGTGSTTTKPPPRLARPRPPDGSALTLNSYL